MSDVCETACQRLERLKGIRERIITGEHETEVEHEAGNGVRSRARFGKPDLGRLDRMIIEAEKACAIERGEKPKSRRNPVIGARSGAKIRRR